MRSDATRLVALAPLEETGALVEVAFSPHAVENYIRRVRPALDMRQALLALQAFCSAVAITRNPPTWLDTRQRAAMYLTCLDVAFPLDPAQERNDALVAKTCLTSDLYPAGRAHRGDHRGVRHHPRHSGRGEADHAR
jgi:hypothetical protein